MHNKTVSELIDDIKNKKVSSVELTKYFIERVKKLDKKLNSFITITEDYALNSINEMIGKFNRTYLLLL